MRNISKTAPHILNFRGQLHANCLSLRLSTAHPSLFLNEFCRIGVRTDDWGSSFLLCKLNSTTP